MHSLIRDRIALAFAFAAVIFWVLAIIGGIRAYSPVPFWDSWNGYLGFYFRLVSGDWSVWWEQHNEHRILLARLIFWANLAFFEGKAWVLIVVNYLLIAAISLVFFIASKEIDNKQNSFFGFFLVTWLISWSQKENLTWGFQSQFFLAQFLPLLSFYLLHRAVSLNKNSRLMFLAACFSGLLSIGSMANGILTLPMMTLYAIVSQMSKRRVLVLAFLAGTSIFAYLYDYHAISSHGSLWQALNENPLGLAAYVFTYLGSPFYYFFGESPQAFKLAQIAGFFFVTLAAIFSLHLANKKNRSSLQLAMLIFIFYIGGTAFGTAGGRLSLGLDQAISSRYATPALMAWAALFILLFFELSSGLAGRDRKVWLPASILILMMLPSQLKALHPDSGMLFDWKVAALAIELGIKDKAQIGHVYPSTDIVSSLGIQYSIDQNLSVFGYDSIKNARDVIGTTIKTQGPVRECLGHLDELQAIDEDNGYFRLKGWFFDPENLSLTQSALVIDNSGMVIGYVLIGQQRLDLKAAINPAAVKSGFKGYVVAESEGKPAALFDPTSGCITHFRVPTNIVRINPVSHGRELVSVGTKSVLPGNQWVGSDFQQSHFDDLVVFGSFIKSDSAIGSISLNLKNGDKLLYRSGPTGGKQFVKLPDTSLAPILLPVSTEWKLLEFSGKVLPDTFLVEFSDDGTEWGEWSAIAILK